MVTGRSPELRVVGQDDWRLWRDVRAKALAEAPDAFGSTLAEERAYDELAWRRRLSGRAVVCLVDRVVVGCGGSYEEEPGVHAVVSMWVQRELRGRGLGRLVLGDILGALPDGARACLWVTEDNPAYRLYQSAGFVPTGETAPLRPGSPTVKLRMARPVPASGVLPHEPTPVAWAERDSPGDGRT